MHSILPSHCASACGDLRASKALVRTRSSLQLWLADFPAQATEGISISPALLRRARSVAAEHGKLTRQLTVEYDTDVAKKLGESSTIVNALEDWESASNVSWLSCFSTCSNTEEMVYSRLLSSSSCYRTLRQTQSYAHWPSRKSTTRLRM